MPELKLFMPELIAYAAHGTEEPFIDIAADPEPRISFRHRKGKFLSKEDIKAECDLIVFYMGAVFYIWRTVIGFQSDGNSSECICCSSSFRSIWKGRVSYMLLA